MKKKISLKDISNSDCKLVELTPDQLVPLPYPYDDIATEPQMKPLTPAQQQSIEGSLDGVAAIGIRKPATKEEEEAFVQKFLSGLKKLLSKENNWTFLQPLMLSLENCAKCQNCSESCPVYIESGKQEIYRPTYRAELLRRIIRKYIRKRRDSYQNSPEAILN
jgi:ferredoxin